MPARGARAVERAQRIWKEKKPGKGVFGLRLFENTHPGSAVQAAGGVYSIQPVTVAITALTVRMLMAVEIRIEAETRCGAML